VRQLAAGAPPIPQIDFVTVQDMTPTNNCLTGRSRPSLLILFTSAFLAVAWPGCRTHPQTTSAQQPQATNPHAALASGGVALKAPGEAKIGDRTPCAMHSDSAFTVTESTPKAAYQGRTYYFCCPECAQHFSEHPADFVK